MSNDRMTVVPDFLGELDSGVFVNKIAAALNTTASVDTFIGKFKA